MRRLIIKNKTDLDMETILRMVDNVQLGKEYKGLEAEQVRVLAYWQGYSCIVEKSGEAFIMEFRGGN